MNIQSDLYVLLPELILAVGAMVLLLIGAGLLLASQRLAG